MRSAGLPVLGRGRPARTKKRSEGEKLTNNPLALTATQRQACDSGDDLILTRSQQAYLQRDGVVAQASETYAHPSGAFVLAPATNTRRKRVQPDGFHFNDAERSCLHCGRGFTPERDFDRFCSPVCATKHRQRMGR